MGEKRNTLVDEISDRVEKVADIAQKNCDKFQKLGQEHLIRTKEANQTQKGLRQQTGGGCCAGISALMGSMGSGKLMTMGPHSLAEVPLIGQWLTVVSKGYWGASSVSLMPGAHCLLGLGACGLACVGCGGSYLGCDCALKTSQTKRMVDVMIDCRNSAQMNEEMWRGLLVSTQQLKCAFLEAQDAETRPQQWMRRMEKLGREILKTRQAINVNLCALELCGHVPKNYDLPKELGPCYQKYKQHMRVDAGNDGINQNGRCFPWMLCGRCTTKHKGFHRQAGPQGDLPCRAQKLHNPHCIARAIGTPSISEGSVGFDYEVSGAEDGSLSAFDGIAPSPCPAEDCGCSEASGFSDASLGAASLSSWTVIPRSRCFPPRTISKRLDKTLVRAAELKGDGDEVLLGSS